MSAADGSTVVKRAAVSSPREDEELSGSEKQPLRAGGVTEQRRGSSEPGRHGKHPSHCGNVAGGLLFGILFVTAAIGGAYKFFFASQPSQEGSEAIPRFRVTDKILHRMLVASQDQYHINLAARFPLRNGRLPTNVLLQVLKANFLIPNYPCPLQGRFGTWGDGGKSICLRHHGMGRPPLVISVGTGNNAQFEEEVAARLGGFSHVFDYALNESEQEKMRSLPFLKFYNFALSASATTEFFKTRAPQAVFLDLKPMLGKVGTNYVDIFKINCGGCEHSIFQEMQHMYSPRSVPFGQILVRLHWLGHVNMQMASLQSLEDLGYRMFHAEVAQVNDTQYEVAFIHERLVNPDF